MADVLDDTTEVIEYDSEMFLLPEQVYVSGMPLLYRGYNGLYKLNPACRCYERKEHEDYYGLPIKDTRLVPNYTPHDGREWRLQHKNGRTYEDTSFYKTVTALTPLGEWSSGILVTNEQNWKTWMRSNQGLVLLSILLIVSIYAYFW